MEKDRIWGKREYTLAGQCHGVWSSALALGDGLIVLETRKYVKALSRKLAIFTMTL